MKKYHATITNASMGICKLAIDLFGVKRIDPGSWGTPVYVDELSQEEADFAIEFFALYECRVIVREC
jgi:hypothetical protein